MPNEGDHPARPWIEGRPQDADLEDRLRWFESHFEVAASEILEFISDAQLTIDTKRVLDIGCGDGAIDLGLCTKASPARLLGLDLVETDLGDLAGRAHAWGIESMPTNLEFGICSSTEIPLPDRSVDVVISWSVFEHVANPIAVLSELRRVIRPGGFMFLQIWPLFHSQHGSHLWYWYPDGWVQQTRESGEVVDEVIASQLQPSSVTNEMLTDFTTLNRLTISELQRALTASGFRIRRIQMQSDLIEVPRELSHKSVIDLATSGVKLIAIPE